ncbi:MAG: RNase adapter RapZ [bacterium]|jgi:RNase adaptor protein for sRNA GlmZ degradation|nr:hypothetical protein [candidate division KSB1 bacterium]MDH7559485.1 RNase adapter RapZ [bacterium]
MAGGLTVYLASFSYVRDDIPTDPYGHGGGFVFDCRLLPNPGRDPAFAAVNGLSTEVRSYLEERPEVQEFLRHVFALVDMAVANYTARGFEHLMVAFGCTGGQHRSVFCAESLAAHLRQAGVSVEIRHLTLGKGQG